MPDSLDSQGIWMDALGGGHRQDLEDGGVDGEWRPHVTSGRRCVQSNA